jgi:hypothetical protein
VRPATIVGSAKGRSMSALTIPFPRKESRTSTHAISVPATALIATTTSETTKVSFSEATAEGLETARQKLSAPFSVDFQTTAASGSRTMNPRYADAKPRPSGIRPGAFRAGSRSARALAAIRGHSQVLLDLGHEAFLRVEELGLDLTPAAELLDGKEG